MHFAEQQHLNNDGGRAQERESGPTIDWLPPTPPVNSIETSGFGAQSLLDPSRMPACGGDAQRYVQGRTHTHNYLKSHVEAKPCVKPHTASTGQTVC